MISEKNLDGVGRLRHNWVRMAVLPVLLMALVTSARPWAEPDKVAEVKAGVRAEAKATWWGFDPEDSTAYIQRAIDSGAAKITIPDTGQDWVVEPLYVTRDNLELFFEPGVVVSAKRGAFIGRNDCLFLVADRENVVFSGYGATFRMWKRDYIRPPYERAEWRHTLSLRGSRNIEILGLTLRESGGDGIYIGRGGSRDYSENVVIRDVVCEDNHRQGISVVSADNLLIENSVFTNTRGTAPMAGIDCETHSPEERLSNITIRNNAFINNDGYGMLVVPNHQTSASAPISILWEGNYVRGGRIGIMVAHVDSDTPEGEIVFRNNIIENTSEAGVVIRRMAADSGLKVKFAGNTLINTGLGDAIQDHAPSAPVVLTAQSPVPVRQGNVSFDRDLVIHHLDEPAIVIGGPWRDPDQDDIIPGQDTADERAGERFVEWAGIAGSIRVVNPYGNHIDRRTPVSDFTLEVVGHLLPIDLPRIEEHSLFEADRWRELQRWPDIAPPPGFPLDVEFSSWRLRKDPDNLGRQQQWYAIDLPDEQWRDIPVPAFYHQTWAGRYHGYAWYRVTFDLPENAPAELELHFGGVDEQAWVYLNGELIGEQSTESTGMEAVELWNIPFSLRLPRALLRDRDNLLAVRVHTSMAAGGIYEPVAVYVSE